MCRDLSHAILEEQTMAAHGIRYQIVDAIAENRDMNLTSPIHQN
jgi:hypothetical protein